MRAIVPGPGTIRRFYARSATTPFARNDDTYINLADRRTGIASIAKRAEALLSTKNRGSRTCPVDFPAPGHDAMACAICLTLALVLTFFKWTGSFPAGYAAYTQNAWQALFGTMSADPVSDKLFEMEATLKDRLASSWWLLPYLILLIPAVVLVWRIIW